MIVHIRSLAFAVLLLPGACAGAVEEESPEGEACEHAADGPAAAHTAVAADGDDAPDVSAEHTRHDVALVVRDGGNGGFVRFESEGGDHIVFLSVDVPIAFATADDGAVIDEDLQRNETTCDEIVTSHHVELPVGLVSIELGPTTETAVSLVVERIAPGATE